MPLPVPPPWPSPRLRRLALALWIVALAAVIFLSLSPRHGPPGGLHIDKLAHFAAYAVLAALPFAAFLARRAVLAAAAAMLPFGLVLEGLQALVPQRSADPFDALANAAGVAAGIALGTTLRRFANRLRPAAGPAE